MKILLADDDVALADVTAFALQRAGFMVVHAYDGEETLRVWRAESPDLIILDIQMPLMDGLEVCTRIRASSSIPIILLTARNSDDDIVHGLELGADDYVSKPFSPKQLIARAQAVLRRSASLPRPANLALGTFTLDTNMQALVRADETIRLTPLEFRLLHYLLVNRGQVVPTDTILNHVWGYADSADRAMLKQLAYRLRQKIESDDQKLLETVPGIGYTIR